VARNRTSKKGRAHSPIKTRVVPRKPSVPPPAREDRLHINDRRKDQRAVFERDRDRVLYCSAFRRLAGVTQVVHTAEGHIYHNRLTHSLKVAQVGRRLAEYLLIGEPKKLIKAVGGIDPNVVETAALAHDLGHPPFGHIAEEQLNEQLQAAGVSDGFEGNAQSFRIVTQVAIRNRNHRGLNLTRATLNAILKYPWGRGVSGKESKKWGYYYTEKQEFDFARGTGADADRQQSAEAALMDWADDVTYSAHDVDDFYRAALIPLDQLLLRTAERTRFIDAVYARWKAEGLKSRLDVLPRGEASKFFDQLAYYCGNELHVAYAGTPNQRARLSTLVALLIRRYILGPEEGAKAVTLVASPGQPTVQIEPRLRAEVELLKALMHYYVFDNPALVTQQFGQRRVIRDLFEIYFEAVQPKSRNSSVIPHPFRDRLKEIKESDGLERPRLVADLIANMTEQQALLLHQRLTGLAPGSVRDPIIR
jgi:dGTPase